MSKDFIDEAEQYLIALKHCEICVTIRKFMAITNVLKKY